MTNPQDDTIRNKNCAKSFKFPCVYRQDERYTTGLLLIDFLMSDTNQGNNSRHSIGQTHARQPDEAQESKQSIGAGLSADFVGDLGGFGVGSSLGMLLHQEQQQQQSNLSVDAGFGAEAQRLVAQLTPAQRVALAAAALGCTTDNKVANNSIDYGFDYIQNSTFHANQSIPAADQQLHLQLLAFQRQQQQELMVQQIQMLQIQVTAAQMAGSPLSSSVDPFLPIFQQQQFQQLQFQLQQQFQQQQQDIHPLLRELSISIGPPESTMGMNNQFVDPFLDPLPLTRFDSALQSNSASAASEKKQKSRRMGSLFRAFSGSASPPRNNSTEQQQSFPISSAKWLGVGRKSSPPNASSNYSKNDSGNEEDGESDNDGMDLGKLLSAKSAKSSKLKSLRVRSAEKLGTNVDSQNSNIIQHDSDDGVGSDASANFLKSLNNTLKNRMAIGSAKSSLIQQQVLSMPAKSISSSSLPRLNNVPRVDSSNSSNSASANIKLSDSIAQQIGTTDFKGAINMTSSTPSSSSSTIGSELSDSEMSIPDSEYFASFGLVASDNSEHGGNSPKQDSSGSNEFGHPYTCLACGRAVEF
ncbi:hypothetical protein HK100_003914 [Physocladia obscura]|uniref:Uncharacterized protein n=1 Tax=Physocladia obscura TaxID=109957 RepID=A0AAD5T908_9FUNG|nr:hypothetical protein HK100_003914 [Physocladia obscura]